jgi:DNA helicase-2/ATP-dependent DNA helicase PcrA
MLVWRVLYDLVVHRIPAEEIVVTTFTRRAATELQIRIVERCDDFLACASKRGIHLLDPQVHNLRIGTIHSLCDSLLAEFDSAYMEAGTQLIDEAERAVRLARDFRFALGFKTFGPPRLVNRLLLNAQLVALFRSSWSTPNWPANTMEIVSFLSELLAQHCETWMPRCGPTNKPNGIDKKSGVTGELIKLQGRWERYLDEHHILDFVTIQNRFSDRQSMMIGRFRHIFVDEFQDTNPIQFAIHTRWLLNAGTRLTVVGDDDQAIYRFRGSDIECFRGLEPHCKASNIAFRREELTTNHRSTQSIIDFSRQFKAGTILSSLSMLKSITPEPGAPKGKPVRLLKGAWQDVCNAIAQEVASLGLNKPLELKKKNESVAVLAFSTSERESKSWKSPALAVRRSMEALGIRVYNPRNKMAGHSSSPVAMLLGLVSYLIDPVTYAPVGKKGRNVLVWASNPNSAYAVAAISAPPNFPINQTHIAFQKKFMKADGGDVGAPQPSRSEIIKFIDGIRKALTKIPSGKRGRLTLAGFVSRLLTFPLFRHNGFTVDLFRQALFTQLLEANIAPTRLTMKSLDQPLEAAEAEGKVVWEDRFWSLLNHFGAYLDNNSPDDLEVEEFEEDAVLLITFHQAKGLEFDHVYVAGTGRDIDLAPALRTQLFSGENISFKLGNNGLETSNLHTTQLAAADREREVYVAMTRAKQSLTILHDTDNPDLFMKMNAGIEAIFKRAPEKPHSVVKSVKIMEAQCRTM